MKVTNSQAGPRGINTTSAPVLIDPGQTVDVEVSSAELKVAKQPAGSRFAGKDSSQSAEFQGKAAADREREDLKKQADDLGIELCQERLDRKAEGTRRR
ncbi:hypothetical protein [Mesorhizobium sp. M0208]|uniref:hypothetical protein n=1 Tax=Mesorhizobium sp. M0208 TaxID=2956916 RepID=UPI0033391B0E